MILCCIIINYAQHNALNIFWHIGCRIMPTPSCNGDSEKFYAFGVVLSTSIKPSPFLGVKYCLEREHKIHHIMCPKQFPFHYFKDQIYTGLPNIVNLDAAGRPLKLSILYHIKLYLSIRPCGKLFKTKKPINKRQKRPKGRFLQCYLFSS